MPRKDNRIEVRLSDLPRGHAICAAPATNVEEDKAKPQRWRLNSGGLMSTYIGGLGFALLVIDLAGVQFEQSEIPMLREHGRRPETDAEQIWYVNPIGRWTSASVDLSGIYGSPVVYEPETPFEEKMPSMIEGGEVAALMRRGHPWQASVKIVSAEADYELVAPGQSVEVNGRTETAPEDLDGPRLFICRRCKVTEASVCLFGADSNTGAVAASRTQPNQEKTMEKRLEALLKKHGEKHAGKIAVMLSKGKSDEEISVQLSEDAAKEQETALAEKDAKITELESKLTENEQKIAEMQAKLDALKGDDEETSGTPPATKGESENSAPKSVQAGMALLRAEGSKLTGFKLRSAVLSRFPSLRETVPSAVAKTQA